MPVSPVYDRLELNLKQKRLFFISPIRRTSIAQLPKAFNFSVQPFLTGSGLEHLAELV